MRTLSIDIETFSSADLAKTGVYKYCESPDFEILLFAYSFDSQPVRVVELAAGEDLPDEVLEALEDELVLKKAFNANFERTAIAMHLHRVELKKYRPMPPEQWACTMVKSAMLGLPLSLGSAAKALKLDVEKDTAGTALINYFSKPCKPTKANGMRTRNLPQHNPEKWKQFVEYCRKDVQVEQEIGKRLDWFTIPPMEVLLWNLDQRINDYGVMIEPRMVINAINMSEVYGQRLVAEAITISGLTNPNSGAQLKKWLSENMGEEVTGLTKADVPLLLDRTENADVTRMLEIRQEMSKTSVKKYEAMRQYMCVNGRACGLFQFGGASKTFRWAGRGIQLQNLPQNHLKHIELARTLVMEGDINRLEVFFDNVPDTLSQLIRTALIAPEGSRLIVADYAAIELIVGAWLAGEQWVIEEFNGDRKMYEKTASKMFNVDIKLVTKDSPERQKGKIACLACQYGGGVGALTNMDSKNQIPEEEKPLIVKLWRKSNPKIVAFWYILENAAVWAIEHPGEVVPLPHSMSFFVKKNILFFKLPSGRCLTYRSPKIGVGKFDNKCIFFEGIDQTTKQWGRQDTYSGKLFENLCQAVARDCLAEGLLTLDKAGYKIVAHVHDETVSQMPIGDGSLKEVCELMSKPIPWAKGLPLAVEGFETAYYKK